MARHKIYDTKFGYITEYQKRACTSFTLRYHNVNDKAVIEKLKSVSNKGDYVRQLILNDLATKKED